MCLRSIFQGVTYPRTTIPPFAAATGATPAQQAHQILQQQAVAAAAVAGLQHHQQQQHQGQAPSVSSSRFIVALKYQ